MTRPNALLIMVSGPFRHGSDDPEVWAGNLRAMHEAALEVHEKGHLPVIGVDVALPLIGVAGAQRYDELMMPISLALAARCDAVLRIGGPSRGADQEVQVFVNKGLPVYRSVEDVPPA